MSMMTLRALALQTSPDALLTVAEAGALLGYSSFTIERYIRRGELAYIKTGKARSAEKRIRLEDLREWQRERLIRPGQRPVFSGVRRRSPGKSEQ